MALPGLIWSPRTKTSNEILIYANLGVGLMKFTKVFYTGGLQTSPFVCCGGTCICPNNSFWATMTLNKNGGAIGPIVTASPLYAAAEGQHDPTIVGDMAGVACLPDPEDDFLICFDQGVNPTPGLPYRPIPAKFNAVDHYVRQRSENTITLNDLFVADYQGLQRIRGIPVTVIIKISPEGSGVFQEIQYYCNVILNPSPMNSGSDGNASIDISMEGPFSFCAIFTAAVP